MYSPLFHLIHLPKSAGNSIWRDLIASADKCSINPNHVIKLDTRNFVDDKYWKALYFQKSQEYNNNTSFIPQNSLSILAHKEVNKILQKFKFNHKILIHHHNSGAFRLPLEKKIKKNNDYNQTSSHKWDLKENPEIYVFTLRNSLERSISQIKFAFMVNSIFETPTTPKSKNYKNGPYWIGGLDADAIPFDRRPAIEMLAMDYERDIENRSEYIEYALQIIPEFATYQLRYILTFIVSKNPTETNEILWMRSNEEILKLWNISKDSIKNMSKVNKIGAIYLDEYKKFYFSNSFEKFISEHLEINTFKIDKVFQETKTYFQEDFIEVNDDFCFYSKMENKLLKDVFGFPENF